MDGDQRRLIRPQERDHGAGIQEPAPRLHLYRVAGMGRSSRRHAPGFAPPSLSGAAPRRTGGDLRRPDDLRENPERSNRLFRNETVRQFRPGLAPSANRRTDHQCPHGTVAGWPVSIGLSSATRFARRRFGPGNRPSLLGPIRAGDPKESGALAVDVQTLALSAGSRRTNGISFLRERLAALRETAQGKRAIPGAVLTRPARCGFHSGNYETSFPPPSLPLRAGCSFPDELRHHDEHGLVA